MPMSAHFGLRDAQQASGYMALLYLAVCSIQKERESSVVYCLVQGGKGGAELSRAPFLTCSPEFPGLSP